jgi:hypothetical protein
VKYSGNVCTAALTSLRTNQGMGNNIFVSQNKSSYQRAADKILCLLIFRLSVC